MMSSTAHHFASHLEIVSSHILGRDQALTVLPTLPSSEDISSALASLPKQLPLKGLGTAKAINHLLESILPGILQAQNGPRYFGFVTGGVTPAAQLADILSGSYDENPGVTLHQESASTAIEQRTLEMVLDLLDIPRSTFMGRTLTTGATGSNILGLACARDYLYANSSHLPPGYSYAQSGPPTSSTLPSPPIIILGLHPHFSISKAASLVGIGGGPNVMQAIPAASDDELAFDMDKLEERLKTEQEIGRGTIVVYGVGEVNTGGFGRGLGDVATLCTKYGAWLHVDAAFGGFAGLMPELAPFTKDMDKADSLTLDAHKWLNVPYDCGIFYTKTSQYLTNVFQPPAASAPAYLASNADGIIPVAALRDDVSAGTVRPEDVPSPLFVGLENSRRFRALPLYASLLSLGKDGYQEIIIRNIHFAQLVAKHIVDSESYELLNTRSVKADESAHYVPSNIVLFRADANTPYPPSDPSSAVRLTRAINATRRMYVSSTQWRGQGAVRIAVSNWRTGMSESAEENENLDLKIVKEVLDSVVRT